MDKLFRNYVLTLDTLDGGLLVVEPPFTMEFDIQQNTLASINTASIRVRNLAKNKRNSVRKDRQAFTTFRSISLYAGYQDNLPLIFKGNISQAWSFREGTDFITQAECYDGGFASVNAFTGKDGVFAKGTTQEAAIRKLGSSLSSYGVDLGVIGSFPDKSVRGAAFSDNTLKILDELSGKKTFIYNSKLYCLNNDECAPGEIDFLDSSAGLLGTPLREDVYAHIDLIFEPRVTMGQKIRIDSKTGDGFDQEYKIISIKHRGMISESVCGDAITSLGLLASNALKVVG